VHALGGGVLVAEVQTASDTTFRIFDWGRTGRELHIQEALACIDFTGKEPETVDFEDVAADDGDWAVRPLVSCEHFQMNEWTALGTVPHAFVSDELSVLMVVSGSAIITWGEGEGRTLMVGTGDTVVLPAGLASVEVHAKLDLTLLEIAPPRTN
jgi:mannose-6-phosphate isomerase